MEGTTDLDFNTVVGGTYYVGLLIISAGTATILTIWIKITSSRCQLPTTDDIGIRATRNLDSIFTQYIFGFANNCQPYLIQQVL